MIQMGLDGNLSLGVTGGGAIWSTAPSGVQGDIGFMLDTGWFRIEGYAGIVDWSTPTSVGPGGYLQVQDDGHLALKTASRRAGTVP